MCWVFLSPHRVACRSGVLLFQILFKAYKKRWATFRSSPCAASPQGSISKITRNSNSPWTVYSWSYGYAGTWEAFSSVFDLLIMARWWFAHVEGSWKTFLYMSCLEPKGQRHTNIRRIFDEKKGVNRIWPARTLSEPFVKGMKQKHLEIQLLLDAESALPTQWPQSIFVS